MKTKHFLPILFLAFCTSMYAQKPKTSNPILSDSDLKNFVENFKNIETEFKTLDIDYSPENDVESTIAKFKDAEEVNTMLKKYGYSDFTEFSTEAWAITACYAKIKIETEGAPELQRIHKGIDEDENLNAEQKQRAKDQVAQAIESMLKAFDGTTNKEDIETVRPYMSKLSELFEEK